VIAGLVGGVALLAPGTISVGSTASCATCANGASAAAKYGVAVGVGMAGLVGSSNSALPRPDDPSSVSAASGLSAELTDDRDEPLCPNSGVYGPEVKVLTSELNSSSSPVVASTTSRQIAPISPIRKLGRTGCSSLAGAGEVQV